MHTAKVMKTTLALAFVKPVTAFKLRALESEEVEPDDSLAVLPGRGLAARRRRTCCLAT